MRPITNLYVPLALSFLSTSRLLDTARDYTAILMRLSPEPARHHTDLAEALRAIEKELCLRGVSDPSLSSLSA